MAALNNQFNSNHPFFSPVPCPPQNVSASVNCSNALAISWKPSADALNYTASVTDNDGTVSTCISSDNTCSVEGLPCGKTFSVQVKAHTATCDSQLSLPVNVSSGTVWKVMPPNLALCFIYSVEAKK